MMSTVTARFRALHAGPCFVMANAWDAGSARIMAGMGFAALATSSGAAAGTMGRLDGHITRDEALAHAHAITSAVDVPVSADLENGFADAPEDVAQTVRMAARVGLAGCSIEDARAEGKGLYGFDEAVVRVEAASRSAAAHDMLLTARAEGFLRGAPDLEEVIRRLRAFEAVGADVLMAPGLPDLDAVRRVCAALTRPFNFMVGIPGKSFSMTELAGAGVRRISLATSLWKAAMAGMMRAAEEVRDRGTFNYVQTVPTTAAFAKLLGDQRA
jgi:2-methylisocitrate lyase-like PEP mutase family enzyme